MEEVDTSLSDWPKVSDSRFRAMMGDAQLARGYKAITNGGKVTLPIPSLEFKLEGRLHRAELTYIGWAFIPGMFLVAYGHAEAPTGFLNHLLGVRAFGSVDYNQSREPVLIGGSTQAPDRSRG